MTHATMRPEFGDLIDLDAPIEQLGTGFTFTEGPIWHPVDHYLLFSRHARRRAAALGRQAWRGGGAADHRTNATA